MKYITSLLAATVLCGSLAHAAEAAPVFKLWVTDHIGATSGQHCARPSPLPDSAPDLTEADTVSFNAQNAQWKLATSRLEGRQPSQWTDHCFVLVMEGRAPIRGLLLSSHSARGGDLPALYLDLRRGVLQLSAKTSGYRLSGQ